MSRFPLAELIERTAADVHPPLYYLLLKAWTLVFGDSPAAMRSLSALFSVLTILAVYQTVRQANPQATVYARPRLTGAALFIAALVAFSVFQIRYGWEARMYARRYFSLCGLRRGTVPRSTSARQSKKMVGDLRDAYSIVCVHAILRPALHRRPRTISRWLLRGSSRREMVRSGIRPPVMARLCHIRDLRSGSSTVGACFSPTAAPSP